MAGLDAIEQWARSEFHAKNEARERALAQSRELIRFCANSIRAVHRGELDRADELLAEARRLNDRISADLRDHPDLYFQGYVQDALKELVEAIATRALVKGESLPDPGDLGVAAAPFLNGLAESVGELRRYVLDQLRQGDLSRIEEILATMDDIYGILVTMDYPDALTGGLRRTTDSVRGILEKTRGDLTTALRQRDLEESLRRVELRLGDRG